MENNKMMNVARIILKKMMFAGIYICLIIFALLILLVITLYICVSPSKNKFDHRIGWEYFWKKNKNGECIIDLAETMNFEWDSLMFLPPNDKIAAKRERENLKPEEMYSDCNRILFFRNSDVVYYAEWYWYPRENHPGGVRFLSPSPSKRFTIYPHDAKFRARKKANDGSNGGYDGEEKFIFLEKVE